MNSDEENREMDLESAEKRAHHNALERKRRDHIKDSFSSLRDAVPSLQGEKVDPFLMSPFPCCSGSSLSMDDDASRAQILKKAADYIQFMRKKNSTHLQDIDDLKRQNALLEAQIRTLENSRTLQTTGVDEQDGGESSSETSESDEEVNVVDKSSTLSSGDYVPT